ncbi:glycosyl transferase [Nitrospira sp.]|nr:glycosyl transferase [Nitrospira sp.]
MLLLLTALICYQWILAIVALKNRDRKVIGSTNEPFTKFLILMPAHNEEICLQSTLSSLKNANYPTHLVHFVVVADRCTDRTVAIAKAEGIECHERNEGRPGKGPAIAWALERMRTASYDALVILDADTVIDIEVFRMFAAALESGKAIQQGFCYISNPWQSLFTRVIAVTSMMRNGLFYTGKTWMGLPAMLAGTGMCFRRDILDRYGWTSFSVGEDWEFSAMLLLAGEQIFFNPQARIYQLESIGLRQASRQRLRWASGRHEVAGHSAWGLLRQGIWSGKAYLVDAAITLLSPNYSSQTSLAMMFLIGSGLLYGDWLTNAFVIWSAVLVLLLGAYFIMGALLTDAPARALVGVLMIPIFLPWRLVIEVLGFIGFGRTTWFRTTRVTSSTP